MPESKLRRAAAEPEDECKMDMSPMIDMVFLLLIFFIVNATVIVVRTDPQVDPAVADQASVQADKEGRIVVNIREDGKYTDENFNILDGEADIEEYVRERRKEIIDEGFTPRLHLRGDRDVVFKHSKVAVRAAAKAEVIQVLFAVFNKER